MLRLIRSTLAAFALIALTWRSAHASFIESIGMGSRPTAMGNAAIGVADELSANYYNPGGLVQMSDPSQGGLLDGGGFHLDSTTAASFANISWCYRETAGAPGVALAPGKVCMEGQPAAAFIPFGAIGVPLTRNFYLAGGIDTPFAGTVNFPSDVGHTEFTADSVGQIFGTLAVSGSYRVNDWFSVGGGPVVMLFNDLWQKTDLGDGAVAQTVLKAVHNLLPGSGPSLDQLINYFANSKDGIPDGRIVLQADKEFPTGIAPADDVNIDLHTWGFRLGALLTPNDWSHLGLVYRSALKAHIEGSISARFEPAILANPIAAALGFADSYERFHLRFGLPQIAGLGTSFQLSEQWLVAIDYVWVNWADGRIDDVVHVSGDGLAPNAVTGGFKTLHIPRSWQNTNSIRAGVQWAVTNDVRLLSGVWWDPSPTPNSNFTEDSDPADRIGFSGGIDFPGLKFLGTDLDLAFHFQWLQFLSRNVGVGQSNVGGGSYTLGLPDANGRTDNAFSPNQVASTYEGHIVTGGLTISTHF